MTVTKERSSRTYPLSAPEADPRFSDVLIEVMADLLHHHGYPYIEDGPDREALTAALHGFLYRTTVHSPA
ncbi:hypothetical protein [Actinoplanes sp. NPDC051494]|uniref:hypothetical protein n=1 Tax=Actinoplanes sp. NPDC051494 TaxID=3363907 RepID=UPI00379CAFDD